MNFYFVRHGETDYNRKKQIQGGLDIPLNQKGLDQAYELALAIKGEEIGFDKVLSSSKLRASKTAEIICKELKLDYTLDSRLWEIDLGLWQGHTWQEVKEKFPVEFNKWFNERRYIKAPNGESYEDMLNRIFMVLRQLNNEAYENVLIITHSAVIMCLLCLVYHTDFKDMKKYAPKNCSLIKLDSSQLNL